MQLHEYESTLASFYEGYTAQQAVLATHCNDRFRQETLGLLPTESHKGITSLLEESYPRLFGAHRVLGGYLVPWVAETLNESRETTVNSTAYATFLGRFWFILYDYQMDEPELINQLGIETAIGVIYEQAKLEYHKVVPETQTDRFERHHQRLLTIAQAANQWEMDKRGKTYLTYDEDDLERVGQKISVVNWTVHAVALAANKPAEGETLEQAINYLLTAIQLNHDLTDAKQDLEIGNCTYPISLALHQAGYKDGMDLDQIPESALEALYSEPILGTALDTINSFAQKGLAIGKRLRGSPFMTHLQTMIRRNNYLLLELRQVDNPIERQTVVIETLKKNQGHPNKHAITLG